MRSGFIQMISAREMSDMAGGKSQDMQPCMNMNIFCRSAVHWWVKFSSSVALKLPATTFCWLHRCHFLCIQIPRNKNIDCTQCNIHRLDFSTVLNFQWARLFRYNFLIMDKASVSHTFKLLFCELVVQTDCEPPLFQDLPGLWTAWLLFKPGLLQMKQMFWPSFQLDERRQMCVPQ